MESRIVTQRELRNIRIFIIVVHGCIIIIHEVLTCDSTQRRLNSSSWLQNEMGLHAFKLLFLLRKANLHEMHSDVVNRVIKITHAHILHVKMLNFAPFTICM